MVTKTRFTSYNLAKLGLILFDHFGTSYFARFRDWTRSPCRSTPHLNQINMNNSTHAPPSGNSPTPDPFAHASFASLSRELFPDDDRLKTDDPNAASAVGGHKSKRTRQERADTGNAEGGRTARKSVEHSFLDDTPALGEKALRGMPANAPLLRKKGGPAPPLPQPDAPHSPMTVSEPEEEAEPEEAKEVRPKKRRRTRNSTTFKPDDEGWEEMLKEHKK